MELDKILEILKVEKLDEDSQTEVKTYLENLVEVKALELTEKKLDEHKEELEELKEKQKEELVSQYETLFEDYKEDIIGKFSNFVDSILDEEMQIPDNLVEYARKGELYHDLIEQFKARLAIDEGVLEQEVKDILSEAKDEIENLQQETNKLIAENLKFEADAKEMASYIYKVEKCADLSEDKKKVMLGLLDGLNEKNDIDKKFSSLLPLVLEKNEKEEKTDEKEDTELLGESKGKVDGNEEEKDLLDEEKDETKNVLMDRFVQILRENKI